MIHAYHLILFPGHYRIHAYHLILFPGLYRIHAYHLIIIGRMHLRGIYFKKDPVEGAAWLLLAHKVGLIEGAIAVGQLREQYDADKVMQLLEEAEARIPSLIEELDAK